jgi:hypothetical protein
VKGINYFLFLSASYRSYWREPWAKFILEELPNSEKFVTIVDMAKIGGFEIFWSWIWDYNTRLELKFKSENI